MSHLKHVSIFLLMSLTGCGLAMSNEDRLDRAEAAFKEGDYRTAIIDTKGVLRKEADNVRGRLLLGRASLAAGDPATAEKELNRAVELGTPLEDLIVDLGTSLLRQGKNRQLIDEFPAEPGIPAADQLDWMLIRAAALLGLRETADARDAYTAVLSRDPDNLTAKLGVVATFQAEGNLPQARSTLDEVLTTHPESVDPWLVSGELNLLLKRYKDAAGNFERALDLLDHERRPGVTARVLTGLAEAQFAMQDTEAARESVARLEALAPRSLSALQLGARVAYMDKDLDTAQHKLQRVLQQAPDFRPAQMLLGVVHLESGNLAQAEMYLSSVVANAPGNIEARTLLAETRLKLRRLDQARETLTPMLSAQNPDSRALSVAGRLDIESGDIDQGVEYLEQSVAVSPDNGELKFQLAAAYIAAGRIAQAQELLDSIEQDSAVDDEYRRGLLEAMAKFRDGAVDGAIASANDLASRYPQRPETNNLIGYFYLTRREFDAARRYFDISAAQIGGNAVSQRFLAAIDLAEGKLDAAETRYADILRMQPDATWAMVTMARIKGEREDRDGTVEWLERARESDSAEVEARALLAKLYVSERNFSEGELIAREAIALNAGDASVHNALGVALLNQRRFVEAAKRFETAIELDTNGAEYHRNLAIAQRALEDTDAATDTLQSAWDREIADVPTAGMLISSKVEAGEFDEALSLVTRLQQKFPDSQAAIAYEGEVHLAAGDGEKAVAAYDRALALGTNRNIALRAYRILVDIGDEQPLRPLIEYLEVRPLDSVARMVLAQEYMRAGDDDAAIAEFEKLVEAEPENAVALNNLAWLYYEAGRSNAAEIARKAYELRPDEANIADTLGWILIETGDVSEGVEILRQAVASGGGSAEHRYHLAAGLAKLGERDAARRTLEEILADNQSFSSRNEAAALLQSL